MLYFVATPIGNLKDVSYRAIETLQSVDLIACEDTRHSTIFLNAYEIKKPLMSYHKFNEQEASLKIVEMLKEGKNIAVISDAGTPGISDPGGVLCRVLIENELEFTVIPGANAFVPALILSGFDSTHFSFVGFLPEKKKDAEKMLEHFATLDSPLIFYSAPHDIDDTVKMLFDILGNRRAVAVRELTKMFEQRVEFNLADGYNGEKRGEFVIVVDGVKKTENQEIDVISAVNDYVLLGLSKMDAIKQVAKDKGVTKNIIYKEYLASEKE